MNQLATYDEPEPRARPDERRLVAQLSGIYLEAGLPLEFAVRSALADYQLFEDEVLCAS